MPLINGMKMACEPCIRGHRSTKCTHANERLMVPVRKPGRPLSACPHPSNQQCGCGSVTAAIPRKQTCHCGSDNAVSTPSIPRSTNPPAADVPSPTKVAFKVQKTSRPPSSRKQSFDPANLERMDMNSVNILPFEQRQQGVPMPLPNGYTMSGPPQAFEYPSQYTNIQSQYGHVPMQPSPQVIGGPIDMAKRNGFTNGILQHNGLEHVIESPLATPTKLMDGESSNGAIGGSCCAPKVPTKVVNDGSDELPKAGSCCAPRQTSHSHSSSSASSISEPQEAQVGSCCSSKTGAQVVKYESISDTGTPNMTPHMTHRILPPNGIPFDTALYPQYLPQTTVFTYPPTYGSFQNPLQLSAWRQSVQASSYAHPQAQMPLPPGAIPFDAPLLAESLDTIHTCSCGDTCQCIGCAAHPYNDATQDYVRSAWASMNVEQPPGEIFSNGQPPSESNGSVAIQPQGLESMSSPTALTPSSTASGNVEEQSLSAADFFFVNYPFMSDGCGGDTQSCPCGDDCQCLGCTIHNQPAIPCAGEKDMCPCGDDCECIGCEIHKGSRQPE